MIYLDLRRNGKGKMGNKKAPPKQGKGLLPTKSFVIAISLSNKENKYNYFF
jgi:hypothetical protein